MLLKNIKFIATLLLCFLLETTFSQHYNFKKYTTEEGLVSNHTFDIMQSSDNRIWTATLEGLSSFNGTTFTNYTKKDGLVSNMISTVFEDSKGRLWVGSLDNGINLIENDKITTPKTIDYFNLGAVKFFYEAPTGTIYIFTNSGIIEYKNNTYTIILQINESKRLMPTGVIMPDENTFYISSLTNGIIKFSLNTKELSYINNDTHGINNMCYSIFKDQDNTIWIGSYGALYHYKNNAITTFIPDDNNFNANRIYSILNAKNQQFILATEGNGLLFFNKKKETFETINAKNGLGTNYIYKIIKDRDQNYWMASYDTGIIRFKDKAFKYLTFQDQIEDTAINDVIYWNNTKLMATNKGLFPIQNNVIQKPIISDQPVLRLKKSSQNELLIITPKEALIINTDHTIVSRHKGDFLDIYKDDKQLFLIGERNLKVIKKDTAFTQPSRKTFNILPIGNQYIFGKRYGLLQYNTKKFDTIPGLHPSKHKNWYGIDAINNHEIMAINDEAIYHIQYQDSSFTMQSFALNRFKGLDKIHAIKVKDTTLWVKANNAYAKINLNALLKQNNVDLEIFNDDNNFLSNETNNNNFVFDDQGNILTVTKKGLFVFNKNEYIKTNKPPKINLSKVELFSEVLNDSLYLQEQHIKLPYDKNYLSFTMEAISFNNSANINYKYRLKGLRKNNTWSIPSIKNNIVFPYLPTGDYSFEFTADNGNNNWQTQPQAFHFKIQKPFWKQLYFWLIILILTGITIYIYQYYKNKKIQLRKTKFTQGLILAQENERARLARELHDGIGQQLILLKKKIQTTNTTLGNMAETVLEDMRHITKNLHPSVLNQLGLTETINQMIDTIDENTELFVTKDIEAIDGLLTPENEINIYRLIQETITNILKHAKATAIEISISKTKKNIMIRILDNGIGFNVEEKFLNSNSLGLQTLKERVRILKGTIKITSTSKGTLVKIETPYK